MLYSRLHTAAVMPLPGLLKKLPLRPMPVAVMHCRTGKSRERGAGQTCGGWAHSAAVVLPGQRHKGCCACLRQTVALQHLSCSAPLARYKPTGPGIDITHPSSVPLTNTLTSEVLVHPRTAPWRHHVTGSRKTASMGNSSTKSTEVRRRNTTARRHRSCVQTFKFQMR